MHDYTLTYGEYKSLCAFYGKDVIDQLRKTRDYTKLQQAREFRLEKYGEQKFVPLGRKITI